MVNGTRLIEKLNISIGSEKLYSIDGSDNVNFINILKKVF
jgi:hypothetical protein